MNAEFLYSVIKKFPNPRKSHSRHGIIVHFHSLLRNTKISLLFTDKDSIASENRKQGEDCELGEDSAIRGDSILESEISMIAEGSSILHDGSIISEDNTICGDSIQGEDSSISEDSTICGDSIQGEDSMIADGRSQTDYDSDEFTCVSEDDEDTITLSDITETSSDTSTLELQDHDIEQVSLSAKLPSHNYSVSTNELPVFLTDHLNSQSKF